MRITLVYLSLFVAFAAQAKSSAEIARGYRACMSVLKMTPKQQLAVAKKAGYPLSSVLWACKRDQRVGLAQMQRENAEYNYAIRHHHDYTPAPSYDDSSNNSDSSSSAEPSSCNVVPQGYGCTNSSTNVSTSGCSITCTGGKRAVCYQGSVELNSCQVVNDDSCNCQ